MLPALLRKTHDAKQRGDAVMTVWGDGRAAARVPLHVDELRRARWCSCLPAVFRRSEPVNVGVGEDVSIAELVELVRGAVGRVRWRDPLRPQQAGRHAAQAARRKPAARPGLAGPSIGLADGIAETYRWFEAPRGGRRGLTNQTALP